MEHIFFGLLGGVDVAQQSNLLRDRPVRIQVQTHRASFDHFCRTLQLGFEEYTLNNHWTENEVLPFLDITENVFYVNGTCVWKLSLSEDGETWWAQIGWVNRTELPFVQSADCLWLVENVSARIQEIVHLL